MDHEVGERSSAPEAGPTAEPQVKSTSVSAVLVSPTGRRQAFRGIRRHLSDDELANSGVQRLILDELEQADADRADLQKYVDRFHEADKEAAVLREKVRAVQSLDIMFGVGVGLGGTLIGLTPSVGLLGTAIGAAMVLAAVFTRARV